DGRMTGQQCRENRRSEHSDRQPPHPTLYTAEEKPPGNNCQTAQKAADPTDHEFFKRAGHNERRPESYNPQKYRDTYTRPQSRRRRHGSYTYQECLNCAGSSVKSAFYSADGPIAHEEQV